MADDDMFINDAEEIIDTELGPALPEQPFQGSLEEFIKKEFGTAELYLRENYAITRTVLEKYQIEDRLVFFNDIILDVLNEDLEKAAVKVVSSSLGKPVAFEIFSMATALVLKYNRAVNRKG